MDVRMIQQTPSETEILVNLYLDSGSDLDCIQKEFLNSVQLTGLRDQRLSVITVHGTVKQNLPALQSLSSKKRFWM